MAGKAVRLRQTYFDRIIFAAVKEDGDMNNVTFERPLNEVKHTEERMLERLIADGLADRQGKLRLNVIAGLNAVGESDMLEQIIGTDTRTVVADKTISPYKSVVLLIMRYGDVRYRGTGFLIKDNMVLTAAHNIYDLGLEKPADEVYIIGAPMDAAHTKTYTGLKVPVEYVAGASQGGSYDWGLIKMNAAMTDLGTINVQKAEDIRVDAFDDVLIVGYPGIVQGMSTWDMWEADGAATYYRANQMLEYEINTSPGNSGSPVMVYYGGCRVAVGINVVGNVNANYAKAIDNDIMDAINEFR